MARARLEKIEYSAVVELLGERCHASPALPGRLNPSAGFASGEEITVPNVEVISEAGATPTPNIVVRVSKSHRLE